MASRHAGITLETDYISRLRKVSSASPITTKAQAMCEYLLDGGDEDGSAHWMTSAA